MFDAFIKKRRIRQISELQNMERRMILHGPLSGLQSISEKYEKLVTDLLDNHSEISKEELEGLRLAAMKNKRLLKASIQGVKQAQEQLVKQREDLSRIGTYSCSGRKDKGVVLSDASDRRA